MPLRRSEEDKQARRDGRAADAYAASPVGRAEAARDRGDTLFQIELEISRVGGFTTSSAFGSSSNTVKHTDEDLSILSEIEAVGWQLEHTGFVFVETGATTSNRIGSTGQGVSTRGNVLGVYVFRAI